MTRISLLLALIIGIVYPAAAAAHEVRPAYLEINQTGPASYRIIWKQPAKGNATIHLVPHLSSGWLEQAPLDQYVAAGFLIRSWNIQQAPQSLAGQTLTIEGLEDTITDVFVRIRLLHGQHLDTILRPEARGFHISLSNGNALSISAFVLLGITHILTGPDHLLFVLGLILIVSDRLTLFKTVTSFTLAHSLTLAAATLGAITLSLPLLNTLIALSILFLAPEMVRAHRGGTSLTLRNPWLIAFAFGLVHGMGFADGLTSLGLERKVLAGVLLSFNIGVEVGQLVFIALILALQRAFLLMEIRWPRVVVMTPAYIIGIVGTVWTLRSGAVLFGMP